LSQEILSYDPVHHGEIEDWDTVGEPVERSHSPAPTVEELLAQLAQQTTGVLEQRVPTKESRPGPSMTVGTEEPVAAQAAEEVPTKAGLVDIASILGAPTVTVVRSSL
jgi:hypothetical protein